MIQLPKGPYDVVAFVVLYDCPQEDLNCAIGQFLVGAAHGRAQVTHEYRRCDNHSVRSKLIGVLNNACCSNKWGWFFDTRRRAINRTTGSELTHDRV